MTATEPDDREVDAARLSRLLGVAVTDVEVLDETAGSANRMRLRLTYGEATSALPEVMFLKRNLADFSFPAEMYSTEVRIYRDVLPGLGIEQPAVYAIEAADDDVAFTILMEDLGTRRGARVGYVLDPTTPDEVDSLLGTLSQLHTAWWDDARLTSELPWATPATTNPPMQFWARIGPRLAHRHLERGHRARLVDPARWPEADWWTAFDRLIALNASTAHTLLHGDVHASNVYYVDGGPGGLLDWQLSLRGCWALDVAYLLTSALAVDDRRANERALLGGYLERLAAGGVSVPTADEAWLQYRQHALYGVLMWLITPDGVHAEAAQAEFLTRCLQAADDLDTMAALRD